MNEEEWYPRFAEIPGIKYQSPKELDFSYLPGRGKVPEVSYYNFDGKRHKSMMWNYGATSSSAAPAKEWKTTARPGETEAKTLLRQLYEILELPGTLSDYHFALQHTHDDLRNYIRQESWVLPEIEKLCLLNIQLFDKHPETITYETDEGTRFFGVTAFHKLLDIYEKEGYLREALEVAKIAARFNYSKETIEELEERIKLLESEEVYV